MNALRAKRRMRPRAAPMPIPTLAPGARLLSVFGEGLGGGRRGLRGCGWCGGS